jgi:8-hydroxy-5-deazaflavin:NADPH oxidoreductase
MHAMDERVEGGPRARATRVGIIGGTGALGRGLAVRLAAAGHRVVIGSRDADRARQSAASLPTSMRGEVTGGTNLDACDADLVLLTVPWAAHAATLMQLGDAIKDSVLVDCVNPLGFDDQGPFALPVPEGSACEQAQQLVPSARVVGAFHHVSAPKLLDEAAALETDVMVVGDDDIAVQQVIDLADSIDGLRGVHAGRLRNARQVEALTANLIAINRRYRVHSGVRIAGWNGRTHS